SYVGSGSFTQSIDDGHGGHVSASGTVSECGHSQSVASYQKTFEMNVSGTWVKVEGSGSGDVNWATGWSYEGSGTYAYPDPSGSGTITGSTSASGGDPVDPDSPFTDTTGGNAPGLPAVAETALVQAGLIKVQAVVKDTLAALHREEAGI